MNKSCREDFEVLGRRWSFDLSKDNVGDYRSQRTDDAYIIWKRCFESRQKVINALVEEFKVIANKNDLEMMLDPTWAKRIAIEAIAIYGEEKPNA